ncbi:formate/nitrite transporter family protein [Desulfurispirillum indicum]|uniref:Formate/nitrite transporter n=1 Tax=Desulfurispirillum indicum (strain ATCC BAA-1389 / DSM 22839 / S5) TaxID=653733 RepID=E6W5V9_DESIS|nr:formate/nitrite transporter family protein [Desulfurispirillum indicum]ADU67244.1 formate/nitrite transporter [Desulfurispirillum indicum S5]UCZ56594.1 formate/nitrite transporter family protein [Desulfurispirillum indicum]
MQNRFLSPPQAVAAIMENGRRVLTQSPGRTFVLSLLAGFYIAFGAQLSIVVTQGVAETMGVGMARFLGGSVFSIGLMLVVVCGAELFTGNTLLAKAALQRQIPWLKVWENWALVIVGNFIGAIALAWLMVASLLWQDTQAALQALDIAVRKSTLSFEAAFIRGILCNWLVCLAVVMAVAARDIAGKILACYVPIMAFVASGFEHSVANMFFIPAAIFLASSSGIHMPDLNWWNFFVTNLIPVTLGNIVGGVVFVAMAYWFLYLRGSAASAE